MKRHLFGLLLIVNCDAAEISPKLIHAIHMVESSGKTGRILGDYKNGVPLAAGPLQIHKQYYLDARRANPSLGGTYEDCFNFQYSVRVFNAYMKKYCKNTNNFEMVARIHNFGPSGYKNPAAEKYWKKVQKYL